MHIALRRILAIRSLSERERRDEKVCILTGITIPAADVVPDHRLAACDCVIF